MKIFKKLCHFIASFNMVKVILFCLLTLSANVAFSQNDILEEGNDYGDLDYSYSDLLTPGPAYCWIVAQHKYKSWTIWAIDTVIADPTTGITVVNHSVSLDGTSIGEFIVNNKWGYGETHAGSATVGVSCTIKISYAGFPSLTGNYIKNHTYVM